MNNNNSIRREFRMFFSLFVAKVNFAFDGAMRHNFGFNFSSITFNWAAHFELKIIVANFCLRRWIVVLISNDRDKESEGEREQEIHEWVSSVGWRYCDT